MSEYTDGNCKYKVEKIGGVLKNEPIQVNINSEYVNSCIAYRYGNIVSVYVVVKKVHGGTNNITYVSGLPIPEIYVVRSIITPKGNYFRYRVNRAGEFGEQWITAFTPESGNELEIYFMYLCK